MAGAIWTDEEIRFLTFLKTCTIFNNSDITNQMHYSAAQIPFLGAENRRYNKDIVASAIHRLKTERNPLFIHELNLMNNNYPTSIPKAHWDELRSVIRDSGSVDSRVIAEAASRRPLLQFSTVDAIESLFWILRRHGLILAQQLDDPRSWPVYWMSHLVDAWNHMKNNGGLDENGKVRDYTGLAQLMNQKVTLLGAGFTALEVEKALHQAIKWGFLRCPYAAAFIEDDGDQFKVRDPVTAETQTPPPPPAERFALPPISQLGLTSDGTATIPAHVLLAPMIYRPETEGPPGSAQPGGQFDMYGAGPSGSH
ncbi:hypothetical protein MMC17_002022 [Xylographa soralifera]|nr:hypothetical protein [Xylographa soralifera]